MLSQTFIWGSIIGVFHFIFTGVLYGNPIVDKVYKKAQQVEPGVRKWDSKPRYLITQFLGTQIEIYILSFGFFMLRTCTEGSGIYGAIALGLLFAAIRVYSRFWNMWIQSTYPRRLLAIEFINGSLNTVVVPIALYLIVK